MQWDVWIALGCSCSCDRALAIEFGELGLCLLAGEHGGAELAEVSEFSAQRVDLAAQVGKLAEVPEVHIVQIGAGFAQGAAKAFDVFRMIEDDAAAVIHDASSARSRGVIRR